MLENKSQNFKNQDIYALLSFSHVRVHDFLDALGGGTFNTS